MATLVQVTLHTADAVSENFIVNNWCVTGDVSSTIDSDALMAVFKTFYTAMGTSLYPDTVAQAGHDFKLYIAGGAKPNYPLYENVFTLASSPASAGLPAEVACCLSFQGIRTPGTPQARRRGRVYLGSCRQSTNDGGRPSATLRTAIKNAATALATGIDGVSSAGVWGVWSPTNGTATPVNDGWIDNAWDTQRSRGIRRTARELWTL